MREKRNEETKGKAKPIVYCRIKYQSKSVFKQDPAFLESGFCNGNCLS